MIYNQRADGHSVSDSMGGTWNGMAGRIELRATSPVWISDVQAFPDLAKKNVHLKVSLGNDGGAAGIGTLKVSVDSQAMEVPGGVQLDNILAGSVTANVTWDGTGGLAEMDVPVTYNALPWDEYHPAIQHYTVVLKGNSADDTFKLNFGWRQISFNEKDLLLNGKLINLRGTHFADEFPLTGYPATDVASWKKIIQECKDYGLNGMRFHSSTPPDAAFEAADELGFYIMAEGPFWDSFSPGSVNSRRLDAETALMRHYYGNHPSWIMMSASNESGGAYGPTWAGNNYQVDPRRLYASSTGNDAALNVSPGPTYASMPHTNNIPGGGGLLRLNNGGAQWAGGDYRAAVANVHIPILSHEIGQICAYPDFGQIAEFTGYLRPSSLEVFKASAEAHGLLDRNREFAWASGKFQVLSYKQEFETNMRTPGLSGFQVLDLHDYLGQGSALVGVVDALWHPKDYVTAAQYARFAGPIVPLARLAKRVFQTNESLESEVELYQFGDRPLVKAVPYWRVEDLWGNVVAEGEWPARDLPIGKNLPLGHISVDLSTIPAPKEYKLVVGIRNTDAENDWNVWVYPQAQAVDPQAAGVFETNDWMAAQDYLAKGGKVLYLPPASQLVNSTSLAVSPVFWNLQMTPSQSPMLGLWCDATHPALAEFPTEAYCDLEWTPLTRGLKTINIEGAPLSLKPIVSAIDDWNRNWRLGILFELKVGPGRLFVSAVDFLGNKSVSAAQLQKSVLDYMASDKFQPALALSATEADKIWAANPADVAVPVGENPLESDLAGKPASTPRRKIFF